MKMDTGNVARSYVRHVSVGSVPAAIATHLRNVTVRIDQGHGQLNLMPDFNAVVI